MLFYQCNGIPYYPPGEAGSIVYSKADLEIQNFAGFFLKVWYNIANQLRSVLYLAG
jgi:hypothetical protein